MFTRDIYTLISLGRSSLKWANGNMGGLTENGPLPEPALAKKLRPIDLAKDLNPEARTALIRRWIQAATSADQEAYRKWLDAQMKLEGSKIDPQKSYYERLDRIYKEAVPTVAAAPADPIALATQAGVDPNTSLARGIVIEQRREADAAVAERQRVKDVVLDQAAAARVEALPADAPLATVSGAQRPVDRSKDPLVKPLFEGYAGGVVSKEALASSVSRAVAYTEGGWQKVYENVVGEKPGDKPDGKKFQMALDQSVHILQQLGGGNAGMDALLQGKTDVYFGEIRQAIIANENKPLTIDLKGVDASSLSPATQTLLGAGLTVVAAVASGGVVIAGHEADAVKADTFVNEFNADKKGGFWNGLGNALTWLKEAAMGRRASITLFANEKEGNVEKYYEDIRSYTKAVMEGKYDSHPVLKEIYPAAAMLAQKAGVDVKSDVFKKALVQSYILNEGFARQGTDWKVNIGLLFVGLGRESITSRTVGTTEGGYGKIERRITKSEVPSELLSDAGVKIDRDPTTNTWIHTIPASIQLPGDQAPLKVVIAGLQPESDGTYKIASDKVQTFHFSDTGNSTYTLTFNDATTQPEAAAMSASPTADRPKQKITGVRNVRDGDPKFALENQLYYVGHADPKVWGEFLRALGSQDIAGARKALDVIENGKKYPALAKALKLNFETIALQGNTYTYGNADSRGRVSPDQKGVDSMRKADVLAAEKRLLDAVGITQVQPESAFKSDKYTPKQASALYPDQEMTLMVAATPTYRNEKSRKIESGAHRLDTMDGSFAIHSKTVPLTGEARDQVIDALATKGLVKNKEKGVQGQVDKLNKFLLDNTKKGETAPTVTPKQYVTYLKTGKIDALGVKGLTEQDGKPVQVFEARAMIAGNVCMNRTHGIVYPLFELPVDGKPVSQSAAPMASLDYTTPTNIAGVEAGKSALGLSPAALIQRTNTPEKPNPSTQPGQGQARTTPGATQGTAAPANGVAQGPGQIAVAPSTGRAAPSIPGAVAPAPAGNVVSAAPAPLPPGPIVSPAVANTETITYPLRPLAAGLSGGAAGHNVGQVIDGDPSKR